MIYRILVTGSREWTDVEHIENVLSKTYDSALLAYDATEVVHTVVVHGGARGADAIAGAWARNMGLYGLLVDDEVHEADWKKYGRRAGMIRNKVMVDLGADICLAFPQSGSIGTLGCMRLAERSGIFTVNLGLA